MRRSLLLVGAAVLVTGSLAVIYAQHAVPAAPPHPMQMIHQHCLEAGPGEAAKSHVPEHFARMLELSGSQLSDIERMAGEACDVLRRTHENILQVLTPEQREKVRELHAGEPHEAGGLHALFKKLHGGD